MIVTCRLATLPLALLDEGDNKLLVGVGRLRSKQRHDATEHPRAPAEMAGVPKKTKSEGQHINCQRAPEGSVQPQSSKQSLSHSFS